MSDGKAAHRGPGAPGTMVTNEQGTVGGGMQQKDPGMPDSKSLPQDDSSQQRQTSGQGGGAKSGGAQAPNTKQI